MSHLQGVKLSGTQVNSEVVYIDIIQYMVTSCDVVWCDVQYSAHLELS